MHFFDTAVVLSKDEIKKAARLIGWCSGLSLVFYRFSVAIPVLKRWKKKGSAPDRLVCWLESCVLQIFRGAPSSAQNLVVSRRHFVSWNERDRQRLIDASLVTASRSGKHWP